MTMFDNLKCKMGFHKPVQEHFSIKHKYRTTNNGRSKKRYYTGTKEYKKYRRQMRDDFGW